MRDVGYLLKRGLKRPHRVPPYLLGRLFPESRWAPDWQTGDGFVTFREGGCGYGRPSGWISDYARRSDAIEPNRDALVQAAHQYPHVEFHQALADDLPFPDDTFDLVVSWPRSRSEYESLFGPHGAVAVHDRGAEPAFEHAEKIDLMVLERGGG